VLASILVLSLVVHLVAAIPALITGVIIDAALPIRDQSLLVVLGSAYLAYSLLSAAATAVRASLILAVRIRVDRLLSHTFLTKLVSLPFSYFDIKTAGHVIGAFGQNAAVRDVLTSTIVAVIVDGSMTVTYGVLLVMVQPSIAVALVIAGLVRLAAAMYYRHQQRRLSDVMISVGAKMQAVHADVLSAMETIKASGTETAAAKELLKVHDEYAELMLQRGRVDGYQQFATQTVSVLTTLILLFWGAKFVIDGSMTLGALMTAMGLAAGFLAPLGGLVSSATQIYGLDVSLDRLDEVLNFPLRAVGSSEGTPVGQARLVAEALGFVRPGSGVVALEGVTLTIEPGERMLIVGSTGSGKSTLCRILVGLYEPTTGSVHWGNIRVSDIDRASRASQIGYVTQDPQLLSQTVEENLLFGRAGATLADAVRAAKLARVHDDVMELPHGYQTRLPNRGLSLSSGQRQRLALARALVSAPRLLILDEATSHIDLKTEHEILHDLSCAGCALIIVTHRLESIKFADRVAVLDRGRLVALGTPSDLYGPGSVLESLTPRREEGVGL